MEVSPALWTRAFRPCLTSWTRFTTWVDRGKDGLTTRLGNMKIVVMFKDIFPNWKGRVVIGIVLAVGALVFNIGFLILASRKDPPGSNGLGTILQGECTRTDTWNKVAHALINVYSTVSQ